MTNVDEVRRKYRRNVRVYDALVARTTELLRREAVSHLDLAPGDRVLDLGWGTGLSLPLSREAVGERGVVHAVDVTPEMLARARERIERERWRNVRVVEADAESLEPSEPMGAVLCYFTHDIVTSRKAVRCVLRCVRPPGRVTIAGVRMLRGWRAHPRPDHPCALAPGHDRSRTLACLRAPCAPSRRPDRVPCREPRARIPLPGPGARPRR